MRSLIGAISMARTSSTRPGCADSLYRGWKQPVTPAASGTAAIAERLLEHDIDDPVRDDNHLARGPIIHRPDNAVEGESRAFDPLRIGVPLDRQLASFLSVDLRDISHVARDDQAAVGDGPWAPRDESLMTERLPA